MMLLRALCWSLLAAAAPAGAQTPLRIDEQVIREAVRATVAEMPKLEGLPAVADFGTGGPAGQQARLKIERAFAAAAVPDCLHPDATRHVPLRLGGWMGLPGWAYAAASGKCK